MYESRGGSGHRLGFISRPAAPANLNIRVSKQSGQEQTRLTR
jgi:hypothetical protein